MSNPFDEEPLNPFDGGDPPSIRKVKPQKRVMASMTKHNFQWHNYKRPTFCAHCGNLLVGMMKQGMRCKRCNVDVHDKCQEDLSKACIELIVGQHNFRERTYKQPTYCDFCKKLLVGLVNQGLKCSECGTNVHEKCQEKIEAKCSQTKTRKSKDTTGFTRSKVSRASQKSKASSERSSSLALGTMPESDAASSSSSLFATMPRKTSKAGVESPVMVSKWTPVSSPAPSPKGSRSPSVTDPGKRQEGGNVAKANEMVGEVIEIMTNNAVKLNERGQKIENLQDNARQLEEKANLFEKKAKEIKKKMWFKNYKMWIALVVALVLLIAIIVVAVVFSNKNKK